MFESNPYRSSRVPLGFVLEHQGRIGGYIGQLPVPMKLGRSVTTAFVGHNFCVEEGFRGHGLKLVRAFAGNAGVPKASPVFLVGTSLNEVSFRIILRYGFKPLQMGRICWLRILRFKAVLKAFTNRQRQAGSRWGQLDNSRLLSVISAPFDPFLRIASVAGLSKTRLETRPLERFGSEFDRLWRDVSAHYGILVVRDSQYLNWRYIEYPLEKPRVFSACDRRGNLRGFLVVNIVAEVPAGLRTAFILELFTLPDDMTAQQDLLRAALRYANEKHVDRVSARFFPAQIGKLLKKNLFFRRQMSHCAYVHKGSALLPEDFVCNEDNWFASPGDGDASL
jgi:hypothetical protein